MPALARHSYMGRDSLRYIYKVDASNAAYQTLLTDHDSSIPAGLVDQVLTRLRIYTVYKNLKSFIDKSPLHIIQVD